MTVVGTPFVEDVLLNTKELKLLIALVVLLATKKTFATQMIKELSMRLTISWCFAVISLWGACGLVNHDLYKSTSTTMLVPL